MRNGEFLSRFLAAYEDLFAKSTDAPVEFGHAGGLAILSTIAMRRRWIERGGEQIHPNLFMLLCADSSRDRKSTSVKLATSMLKGHDSEKRRVGPDNFTPEGLFTFMVGNKDGTNKHHEAYLPIGEFGVFLSHAASHSKNLYSEMCNMYDGADIIKARAKESVTITNPLITLFGGVAYGMLEKYMEQKEWDAGFYPRMLWVTPQTRREPFIIVPESPFTERKIADQALRDLVAVLSSRSYAMRLAKGAEIGYAAFADSLVSDEKQEDATVNAQRERLKNIIWKLAILYQIDEDPNADISAAAMDKAYAFAKVSWNSFKMVFDKTYGAIQDRYNLKIWHYIHANSKELSVVVKEGETEKTVKDRGVWRHEINHWQHRHLTKLIAALAALMQQGVIVERAFSTGKHRKYYVATQPPPK